MSNEIRREAAKAVKQGRCADWPGASVGCNKKIDVENEFTDHLSRQDYMITGLCQTCQDEMYSEE